MDFRNPLQRYSDATKKYFTIFQFSLFDFTIFHSQREKSGRKRLGFREFYVSLRTYKKVSIMNRFISIFCCVFLLIGCKERSIKSDLDVYESNLEKTPKAVYEILTGLQPTNDGDRARHALLTIKAKNLAYIPLEGKDTITILDAIDYYQRRRDSEQVMLGYYLLGSIYRDLGDAPRGVEAFTRVIEVADTTRKDCNYRLMARAEAQKSNLQSAQSVLPKAIESLYHAEYYSWEARDTSFAFDNAFGRIGLQSLAQNNLPFTEELPQLILKCLEYKDTAMVVKYSVAFAWSYLQIKRVSEASRMIELYDKHNGTPYPIYYGTKGELYLARHQVDSAERCFRKELKATDWNNRQTAYRGLKKVFEQRHQADSALKYATLQCDAVDSDYYHKVSDAIIQMEHVYNYETAKEQARRSEMAKQRMRWTIGWIVMAMAVAALAALLAFRTYRDRQRRRLLQEEAKNEAIRAQLAEKDKQLALEENRRMKKLLDYQKKMEGMQATIEEFREEARSLDALGDGVRQMRKQLESGKHASIRNWEALQHQVVRLHPDFVKTLRKEINPLQANDLHLALLIKMGFKPSEIAVLMDKSPSSISMARTRLYAKRFGTNPPTPEALDEWIEEIE